MTDDEKKALRGRYMEYQWNYPKADGSTLSVIDFIVSEIDRDRKAQENRVTLDNADLRQLAAEIEATVILDHSDMYAVSTGLKKGRRGQIR